VKLKLAGQHFTWSFLLADVSTAILGINFFASPAVTSGPRASVITGASPPTLRPAPRRKTALRVASCRLECWQRGLFFSTPGPVAPQQAGSPSVTSAAREWAASGAADVKLPSGLSAAASSAGGATSSPPPAPAADQQAGISSAAVATGQRNAVSAVRPISISKLPLFFQLLLQCFEDVVNPSKVLPQTSHGVEHHLDTRGPPIASPFHLLDTEKLAAAKAEFAALEQDRIIRRSSSPWASPLHMVKKPDGSWRCCGDYHRLNNVTVPDTYPLPNMMVFSSRVAVCSIFTKIYLRKGYYQIPLHPVDILKNAIITPLGLFEFLRLTFGLLTPAVPSSGSWIGFWPGWHSLSSILTISS
jgi:hypothetical protein